MSRLILSAISVLLLASTATADDRDYFACMHDLERAVADCKYKAAEQGLDDSYCDGIRQSRAEECERIRDKWAR